MAVFETSRTGTDGVHLGDRAYQVFSSAIGAVIDWNDRRVTRNALSGLTARELEDIGLSRGDIYDI